MEQGAVGTVLSYEVDAGDRLTRIDGSWDEFARENERPKLKAASVLGT
ncbi:MAG: hypothetical protein P8R42_14195 [Candidatus Binatia bacterium]|nr:hypothetical protein [Candidatus Binatia bacterium]